MKNLHILFFAIGLFIQGCGSETPLFKDEDGVKPDEAVIVFSMYLTDPNVRNGLLFGGGIKSVHCHNEWQTKQSVLRYREINHISASGVKGKYIIAKILPGEYVLMNYSANYEYSSGNYRYTVLIKSPNYSKNYPLSFSIKPGEVKYLGNIEIQKSKTSKSRFQPIFNIHNQISEVRKLMEQKYPSLVGKLSHSLIQKSQNQILLEKMYSSSNAFDLLSDAENAQ